MTSMVVQLHSGFRLLTDEVTPIVGGIAKAVAEFKLCSPDELIVEPCTRSNDRRWGGSKNSVEVRIFTEKGFNPKPLAMKRLRERIRSLIPEGESAVFFGGTFELESGVPDQSRQAIAAPMAN